MKYTPAAYAAIGQLLCARSAGPKQTVGEASSSADVASVLSPSVVCVQWIWGDFHGIGARGSSTAGTTLGGADNDGDQTVAGLYPARTAFILLGPGQSNAADEKAGQKGPPSGSEFGPSILVARLLASSADGLRRRASQLKVLNTGFNDLLQRSTLDIG